MIVHDPTVAERYATALFNVSKRAGDQPAVLADAEELLTLFAPKAKIRLFVESPQVTTEAKEQLLDKALKGKAHPLLYNFLRLLLSKGRIQYVPAILERYRALVEREQGIYEAHVSTASALGNAERATLLSALETYTRAKLKLKFLVDPSLIGGVRFQYGDVLIDDSIKGKLAKLRKSLQGAAAGR